MFLIMEKGDVQLKVPEKAKTHRLESDHNQLSIVGSCWSDLAGQMSY